MVGTCPGWCCLSKTFRSPCAPEGDGDRRERPALSPRHVTPVAFADPGFSLPEPGAGSTPAARPPRGHWAPVCLCLHWGHNGFSQSFQYIIYKSIHL